MKQSEILRLANSIKVLDGKGSMRLRWAVYRTDEKLQEASQKIMKFINDMRPERLAYLQGLHQSMMSKCKTNEEREEVFQNWEFKDELTVLLSDFNNSKEYLDFLESENKEFKPYPINLTKEDIEGLELNSGIFWILKQITVGLNKVMSEL